MLKKGIALTPVKFGISFTTTHLNQAGALVHIYKDGSIKVGKWGRDVKMTRDVDVVRQNLNLIVDDGASLDRRIDAAACRDAACRPAQSDRPAGHRAASLRWRCAQSGRCRCPRASLRAVSGRRSRMASLALPNASFS